MTEIAKNKRRVLDFVDIKNACPYTLHYEEQHFCASFPGGIGMVSKTVIFKCDEALQMKAVAVLIQKASTFRSSIYLMRSGRRANAKSLLGVMSLGIENGAEIEVTAEGDDQQEALDTLIHYLENPKA
jgi:phosphotransferase system HPr (HPr) family protein